MNADPQHLFDPGPSLEPEPPDPALSYDQRLTIRRNRLIEGGTHPTTKRRLAGNGETCKTCVHHFWHHRNRTYHKCAKAAGGVTGGPASDVRVGWPACELWEPKP